MKSWLNSNEPNSIFAKHSEEIKKRLHPQLTIPPHLAEQNNKIDTLFKSRPQALIAGETKMLEDLSRAQKLLGVGKQTRSRTDMLISSAELGMEDDDSVYAEDVSSDPMADSDFEEIPSKKPRIQPPILATRDPSEFVLIKEEPGRINDSLSSGKSTKTEIDCSDLELDDDSESLIIVVKRNQDSDFVAVKSFVHFEDGHAVASYLAKNSNPIPFQITSVEGFSHQIAELEALKTEVERLCNICSTLPSKMRSKLQEHVIEQEEQAKKEREEKESANKRMRQAFAEAFGVDEKILDG